MQSEYADIFTGFILVSSFPPLCSHRMKQNNILVKLQPVAAPDIWILGKNDFEYLAVVGLFDGNGLTDVRNLSTIKERILLDDT